MGDVHSIQKIIEGQSCVSNTTMLTFLDYTLLDEKADQQALQRFKESASQQPIAAICVYPCHLWPMASLKCKKATVVNFPKAHLSDKKVLDEVAKLCDSDSVDEIDYVFPWHWYQRGAKAQALTQSQSVVSVCHQYHKTVKIIIESGAFSELSQLKHVSRLVIDQGFDFLKTSTGHYSKGASLEAADTMLQAITDSHIPCGLKVSGGIANPDMAQQYVKLAQHYLGQSLSSNTFRIGASRLLHMISNPR